MITRRFLMLAAAASALPSSALAKENGLPPPLSQLSGLALQRSDGTATTLGTDLAQGLPTIISLWATWCGPCLDEAKHLAELRTSYALDKLEIVGINIDKVRDRNKIASFYRRAKVNYPQFYGDPAETYIAFDGSLPIMLPRLYVFSAAGAPLATFGRYERKTQRAIDATVANALKG